MLQSNYWFESVQGARVYTVPNNTNRSIAVVLLWVSVARLMYVLSGKHLSVDSGTDWRSG